MSKSRMYQSTRHVHIVQVGKFKCEILRFKWADALVVVIVVDRSCSMRFTNEIGCWTIFE